MSEGECCGNQIPMLKGIDIEIFHESLDRELTAEEVIEVRKWAASSDDK